MEELNQTKLYILTGFLGAGKTTLLRNLLMNDQGKKIGVIMNEFGKVGIDGNLVNKNGIMLQEINRGSIFCSCLKINFAKTMAEMLDEDLDIVIVESSGLADPSNIGEILDTVEQLKGRSYDYQGSICVIDAVDFLNQVDEIDTVYRQTKHAQLAAISKKDLVEGSVIDQIKDKVREINPHTEITLVKHGELDIDLFEQDLRKGRDLLVEDTTNTKENKPKTISMIINEPVTREELMSFLRRVSYNCYRIKGPVTLEDGLVEVDVVNDRIDLREPTATHEENRLVFISKVGPAIIRTVNDTWQELVGKSMKLQN